MIKSCIHEKDTNEKRKRHDNGKDDGVIIPAIPSVLEMPVDYNKFFLEIKNKVGRERLKAVTTANTSLIIMYWEIGSTILTKQENEGWGAKVIDRLSNDLKEAFPDMNGFSPRNLKYMRKFAEAWPEKELVQRTVALIPWRCNLTLLERIKEPDTRLWYAKQTLENGWSKNVLSFQIDTKLHKRIGKTSNNFDIALPPADSDMANQVFKDPYVFDFLGTSEVKREAELERKLIDHMEKFLLELGQGFAFVGRQFHMEVGGEDFYIDMLFYHLKLRCFVIVELKAGKFCPGHVSQLTMYMNIVDKLIRHQDDKPTIGLLLVKEKNHTVAKYALAGNTKPIGVAEWEQKITESLPEDLKPNLPSIEEIEKELDTKESDGLEIENE